jgi:HAMP domain-containing protein
MIITVVPWHTIDMLGFINGLALLAIIALAMLIIVLAAYYYMKIEADRLKELAKTTHDMAHGQIESPMPTLKHNDEIGALNDALDKLQYALSSPTK